MKLEKEFRRLRRAAGLTQRQLAEYLGYETYQMIYNWESGRGTVPDSALKPLAKLFKIDFKKQYLFHLERSVAVPHYSQMLYWEL